MVGLFVSPDGRVYRRRGVDPVSGVVVLVDENGVERSVPAGEFQRSWKSQRGIAALELYVRQGENRVYERAGQRVSLQPSRPVPRARSSFFDPFHPSQGVVSPLDDAGRGARFRYFTGKMIKGPPRPTFYGGVGAPPGVSRPLVP